MPKFTFTVRRTETYGKEIEVEGDSRAEAAGRIQALLDTEGWDAVCPGDDGDYQECSSEVVVPDARPSGPEPTGEFAHLLAGLNLLAPFVVAPGSVYSLGLAGLTEIGLGIDCSAGSRAAESRLRELGWIWDCETADAGDVCWKFWFST